MKTDKSDSVILGCSGAAVKPLRNHLPRNRDKGY